MTRVLFWNIENFSRNKIADPRANVPQKGSAISMQAASQQRLNYILQHAQINPPPSIIVVVEVETSWYGPNDRGKLVGGNGLTACQALLAGLRGIVGGAGAAWMMVPPLRTGKKEGVAVFYDSRNLAFTGPYCWPGAGMDGIAVAPGGNIGNYPAILAGSLPHRPVPNGALQNVDDWEDQLAARVTDFTFPPNHINGGEEIDFGSRRAPYMLCFGEVNNGNIVRNLTLFAVHSPASHDAAGNFLSVTLPNVQEIVEANEQNEVRVVAGDFNVNLLHGGVNEPNYLHFNEAYEALIDQDEGGAAYELGIYPNPQYDNNPPNPPEGYAGFFATHVKSRTGASFLSTNGAPAYYPAYGYIGGETGNYFAIDNFFLRYGAAVNPPDPDNATVLNGVVGSPYTLLPTPPGPPGEAPTGSVAFGSAMPDLVIAPIAPPFTIGQNSRLRGWDNYGRLRSTSDHFAIVIDV